MSCKKSDRDKIQSYIPLSILNGFSKVYERYLLKIIQPYWKMLSNFIAAHRKTYSSVHVLIGLTENWKKHLDNKKVIGAVLMDLSKAFVCVPHDLLIAKLLSNPFIRSTPRIYSWTFSLKSFDKWLILFH